MRRFTLRCQNDWQRPAFVYPSIPIPRKPWMSSRIMTMNSNNQQIRPSSSAPGINPPPPSTTPDEIFSKHFRDITLSDGPIRIYDYGPQNADATRTCTPIFLLHGAMLDTAPFTWRHLLPSLSAHRRVLAIDLPRHGASRPWPASSDLDQRALESIVTSVLDSLSLDRTILIGLSMGAGLAIGYTINNPSRVSSLVAINPGGLDYTRPAQFPTYLMTRCGPLLRWTTRHLASSPSMLRYSIAQNLVAGEQTRDFDALMALVETEAKESARHDEAALDDWQIAAYGPWGMKVNFTPRLEGLGVPSLWVHGQKDKMVTEGSMRRAAEMAPGGRFVSISDAAHMAPLDQPESVRDAIVEFLDEVEG